MVQLVMSWVCSGASKGCERAVSSLCRFVFASCLACKTAMVCSRLADLAVCHMTVRGVAVAPYGFLNYCSHTDSEKWLCIRCTAAPLIELILLACGYDQLA